ncbi:DEAD/DEAH box helicase [Candidatus Micrarchaeota archaeon]|nr:DEAD/DEAH box helicase [Candidatus Micrarchaeota archaeon]
MDVITKVKELNQIEFNPMQEKAIQTGLFDSSIIISSPTASGKTLIAEVTALNSVINKKKKVIYACPLKALASEHFSEFKKKYSKELNIKVTISTGDFDSSSKYLQNYDVIFTTYEKTESLLRHKTEWLSSIGLLIVDEIHEIDSDRGPTIEIMITKLLLLNPSLQVLGLSATIPNSKELAEWLKAKLVESSFRPVKLNEGVYFDDRIHFLRGKEKIEANSDSVLALAKDTLKKSKQALIFCNTRPRSIATAKKLASVVEKTLLEKEKKFLSVKSNEILNTLENPTEQCRILANLVKSGVAFHNAGMLSKQRTIIEDLFRKGLLKVISATPTLASGLNLPAFRVIIPSVYRYTSLGQRKIPIREYKQMAGRAGRPKFKDPVGESILIAGNEFEAEELKEEFILGEIEEISSKLGIEPVLRTHVLAAIATGFAFDLESLEKFFSKTFYAFQFNGLEEIFMKINSVLIELKEMNFIQADNKSFKPTLLGKRVAELYIDPLTAKMILDAFEKDLNEFSFLFLLTSSFEFYPLFSVPKAKEADLWEKLNIDSSELPIDLKEAMFSDISLIKKYNSALLLNNWIQEFPEENLRKEFNVQPGILHSKLLISDWLLYCFHELALISGKKSFLPTLAKLRKRIKYGVKEELLLLTELKGIGRVRARKLFNSNIQSISSLKKIPLQNLSSLLGKETALKIKSQLGQSFSEKELNSVKSFSLGQSTLENF